MLERPSQEKERSSKHRQAQSEQNQGIYLAAVLSEKGRSANFCCRPV
jgi:hypothetical protein